ncbi:DNA repair exonuclease [Candidatus Micrarchaeota archaeon]|nr:DNA repair exonuclease [Candidatus Micrarchaeota archaeon]
MKIAIFSDTHLGYPRFEDDSYIQAERAMADANEKADVILCAGDIFDTRIPKLETLKKAIDIFNSSKIPVFAIFGNHERRAREMTNPVHLLGAATKITVLHGNAETFEKNGERIQILGMGSVPEEYAEAAVRNVVEKYEKDEKAFTILMIHQSIKELMAGDEKELSLECLEPLPFDLIINGHIHNTVSKLNGRFLIPGSTVITQLKKEETAPKGYYIYDTSAKKATFIEIDSRKFFYEKIIVDDAGDSDVRKAVAEKIEGIRKDFPDAIIAIKVEGKLKEGLTARDISMQEYQNVYIDNRLDSKDLGTKLERIREMRNQKLSVREIGLKNLLDKTRGKTDFDGAVFFEKLLEGTEEALEYLEQNKKKAREF